MLTQDIESQRPDIVLLQETIGFDLHNGSPNRRAFRPR